MYASHRKTLAVGPHYPTILSGGPDDYTATFISGGNDSVGVRGARKTIPFLTSGLHNWPAEIKMTQLSSIING